jgi:hypothetical protein
MIGLGTGYNYDSFGAQFALPRNPGLPTLSVRYSESGAWTGWTGITATYLEGSASFKTNVWNYSNEAKQRMYF